MTFGRSRRFGQAHRTSAERSAELLGRTLCAGMKQRLLLLSELNALEVRSRLGTIQIHVYLTLPYQKMSYLVST